MRWRPVLALVLAGLLIGPAVGAIGQDAAACVGTMTSPANGPTVVSVQGQRFTDDGPRKTPARVVGIGPRGGLEWVHHSGRDRGVVWSYDVDPLPNGTVFVTATRPHRSVFYVFDPRRGVVRWEVELPFVDTHDADLLDRHRILIANMRNYNETTGENDDRLLVYNRTTGRVEWAWYFREHYARSVGGNYADDWTHVNDVDRIAPGEYLASPRNFDQVIVVNRSTGRIDLRLGADDEYDVLRQQHNPDYLESETGRPTILVADSENDRIVEYERTNGTWKRTWELTGNLNWPRDADRLPNGNTLVVDSLNHRVIEVTPTGRIVWETYVPWLVYDAERVRAATARGDGPTIRDLGETGTYRVTGGAEKDQSALEACAAAIRAGVTPETATAPSSPGGDSTTRSPAQPGFGPLAATTALLLSLLWVGVRARG